MDPNTSWRISFLRFPLVLGVVWIHAGSMQINASYSTATINSSPFLEFVRRLISEGIARVAVPLFFGIAGYLFFAEKPYSNRLYFYGLKRRLNTLLLPLIVWNALYIALYAALESLPITKGLFAGASSRQVVHFGLFDYLDALFGFRVGPIAYQFWFIRDLLVLILLVPVFWCARTFMPALLAVLFVLWMSNLKPVPWPSVSATLFFAIGLYLSWAQIDLNALARFRLAFLSFFAIGLIYDAAFYVSDDHWFYKLVILSGTLGVWYGIDAFRNHPWQCKVVDYGKASFYLFAAHDPFLTLLRKLCYRMIGSRGDISFLTLYLAVPIIAIIVLLLSYRVFSVVAPKALAFVTGGR